jgi:hypothetical protein
VATIWSKIAATIIVAADEKRKIKIYLFILIIGEFFFFIFIFSILILYIKKNKYLLISFKK